MFRRELEEKGTSLESEEFESAFKKRMGRKGEWEQKVAEATTTRSKWTVRDAENFRNFLRERIGGSATLKAMKTTSFFLLTNYESFILRFHIFSEYVDREGMADQLKKHLTNFTKGTPNVIRSVIEVIESTLEKKVKILLKKLLIIIS